MAGMQREHLSVFANFNQFYLWDRQVDPDVPDEGTDSDVENRLASAPHVVVVRTERSFEVPVTVEIHDSEPAFDATRWDHIAEASLHLPGGELEVHECAGGPVAFFRVSPGWYRVRSFHGGFDSINHRTDEGDDHYLVVLWPAPPSALRVVKQCRVG